MTYILHAWQWGGQQEQKQHRQIRGEKTKKKPKKRSERTPHQGIVYVMPNTTVAERKERQKNETGRNSTANKMHKTPQQNSNIHICP